MRRATYVVCSQINGCGKIASCYLFVCKNLKAFRRKLRSSERHFAPATLPVCCVLIEKLAGGIMEERDFYDERQEMKKATLTCPHCRQAGEYDLGWYVRTKKRQLPGRADERDRAKFAKARSYMVRRDDLVACKNLRCRKRFEVSGVQSVAFLD
jgi:hypothetical protein